VQEWQVQAIHAGKKAAARGEGADLEEVRRAWERLWVLRVLHGARRWPSQ
jgi:predicted transcriptional regulator